MVYSLINRAADVVHEENYRQMELEYINIILAANRYQKVTIEKVKRKYTGKQTKRKTTINLPYITGTSIML